MANLRRNNPLSATALLKTWRPDLGDLRVKSVSDNLYDEEAGIVPTKSGDGVQITIDTGFLYEKKVHGYAKNGMALIEHVVKADELAQLAAVGMDFRKLPWALKRYAEAHHLDYDMVLANATDPGFKTKAWTDTNAARLSADNTLQTAIWTALHSHPEYFLPRMEIQPLEGDGTDATPVFNLRPRVSAASAAAALLHMSSASAGTITVDAAVQQLIPRIFWTLPVDQLGIDLASLHGTDVPSLVASAGAEYVARLVTSTFWVSTLDTTTMAPAGINSLYDATSNRVPIGVANATLDATTLDKVYEAFDAMRRFGQGGASAMFMPYVLKRRLEGLDRADRQYMDLAGQGIFGTRAGTFNNTPIIPTDNLGMAENINGTTFTGSDGGSIWITTIGGEGLHLAAFPGFSGPRITIEKVVGQDQTTISAHDRVSQLLHHPRSVARMHGGK